MSERKVELHRRAVDVFNTRDAEAFVRLGDPRIEFHSLMTIPGGATYHGHDGVRTFFKDLADAWGDDFRVEPEAYFDLGEFSVAFVNAHGRGSQSGAEVAMPRPRWQSGETICASTSGPT